MKKSLPLPAIFALGAIAFIVGVYGFQAGLNAARENGDESSSSAGSSLSAHSSVASAASAASLAAANSPLTMELFASDLPGVRVIMEDGEGDLLVSQPARGIVTRLVIGNDGEFVRAEPVLTGLRGPHGLSLDPSDERILYVAEEHQILRADLDNPAERTSIYTLPTGGRHTTRTIEFGPDGRLYVSIGSSCDTCVEDDERRGSIVSMNKDGSDARLFATGLRNAVFFTWHPETDELWATDMGRDNLGDDIPPEDINVVIDGGHYGWPYCYGDRVRDATFRPNESFDCGTTLPPRLTLPAHSAPLGLAFIPATWPEELRGDLLVAEHGSWNRSTPIGYTVVHLPLDSDDNGDGAARDIMETWAAGGVAPHRPVDLQFARDGTLYVSDDRGGAIYRVKP